MRQQQQTWPTVWKNSRNDLSCSKIAYLEHLARMLIIPR